jgi:L-fuconolactonase
MMDRREFLAVAAAGSVAAAASAAEDKPAMLPVIDTHQHLWDLTKFRLGWLTSKDHPLAASHTPKEYAEATQGLNVVKSVYMEVDVVPEQQQEEADYVVALCEGGKTPMVAAVISGRPNSDGFAKYITPYKGHKHVKGVRQVLHVESTPPGYCLDPKFVKGIQLLGDLGLSFDLCVRPAELPDMAKLVDQCPGTRFILDHCGNPRADFTKEQWERWRKDMAAMAARKNVVCKVSGFIANGYQKGKWETQDLAPAVNGTIEAFGTDRVMFGGDWPVCELATGYENWVSTLDRVVTGVSAIELGKLYRDNAIRFYRI